MHEDLKQVIESARRARDGVLDGSISVRDANSVASNNGTIIGAHALDLRKRIFEAEMGALEKRTEPQMLGADDSAREVA